MDNENKESEIFSSSSSYDDKPTLDLDLNFLQQRNYTSCTMCGTSGTCSLPS